MRLSVAFGRISIPNVEGSVSPTSHDEEAVEMPVRRVPSSASVPAPEKADDLSHIPAPVSTTLAPLTSWILATVTASASSIDALASNTTVSAAPGVPFGDQLAAVPHDVPPVGVHV